MINFQLFAETPYSIEGIDDDVLELLKDEFPQEEATAQTDEQIPEEQPQVEMETVEEQPEQEVEATADADSDNKQVADNTPGNIPYARFKQQNDKLKSVERELAELRARYEAAQQVPPQPAYQPQPVPEGNGVDEREVMSAVTTEAIRRAKERLGLSDKDVDNLEFSDNIAARYQFQTLVQRESNAILEQAKRNSEERIARENQITQTTNMYAQFVNDFQQQTDAEARWQYISEERFLQLPQFEQNAIKGAFERLQARQGTPGDYFLAVNFFNKANDEFSAKNKPAAIPKPVAQKNTAADKLKAAQALPKAPNVQGGMSTPNMTLDDIAELMNKPGNAGIDQIPPDIWAKILNNEPIG